MVKISRRRRRPAQNGVQAIFSGRSQPTGSDRVSFASYDFVDEIETGDDAPDRLSSRSNLSKRHGSAPRRQIRRILVVALLAMIMSTTMVGFSDVKLGLQHHTDVGSTGTGTSPPVRTLRAISPSFYAVSNVPEAIVSSNQSYTGTIATNSDDFILVQIAYSQGSGGNLPDIFSVGGTSSGYARVASATPGVAENFWEQVWTGRASSTTTSTNVTVSPDWLGCQGPCVTSVIISMTIGRYGGVAGIGAATAVAPSASSTSQSASITATQANSMIVELLSHGAYSNCAIDAPQPGSTGQKSRNCFTATTERTEFFDHSISSAQTYTESFSWAQVEVQRGIYLELQGNSIHI